jgi:hypothetical protein
MKKYDLTEEQWLQLAIWMKDLDMYGSYIPVKDNVRQPIKEEKLKSGRKQINNDMAPDKLAAETPFLQFNFDPLK